MGSRINVDTDMMMNTAERIDFCAGRIEREMGTAMRSVCELYRSWRSPAGEAYMERYSSFNNSAEGVCVELIQSYAAFLRKCASEVYDANEKSTVQEASRFI